MTEVYLHKYGILQARRFIWFIKIGDRLDRDGTVKHPVFRSFDVDPSSELLVFPDQLWECSDVEQPRHLSKDVKLKVNCTLSTDLRSVPRSRFKRKMIEDGAA